MLVNFNLFMLLLRRSLPKISTRTPISNNSRYVPVCLGNKCLLFISPKCLIFYINSKYNDVTNWFQISHSNKFERNNVTNFCASSESKVFI